MKLLFTPCAAQDLDYWESADPALAQRIDQLLQHLRADAALATRLSTPLALDFPHLLSVKINAEHRLVYERIGADIVVHQCRFHY